ncbi:hypothetical protein [Niveispirillum sp. BGYR6]|uniref:hypothetical protein n=1 Tax=Niveispirillum sp. BGYR6 TaxID=2971249 RepID=UPI0022B9BFCF|nr:hypothetical protein [Niveispirillum sp. BGYR6]MDG5495912.1 hypothetical protein [Niveispirillum sp. BGYR6]
MRIHRLLILLLSLSVLLLVPTNSGEATAAPVIQQMVTAATAFDPAAPPVQDDDALPLAALSAAEAPAPTPFSDDAGNDGLPAEPGLNCPLRRRIIALTIGGAPPPSASDLTTPWPTGPPTV